MFWRRLARGGFRSASAGDRLWLDRPGALAGVDSRTRNDALRAHARSLIEDGVTVIRGAIAPELCDAVRADYHSYCEERGEDAREYVDEHGHHARLSNFHLVSESALRVGVDQGVMGVLDFLFGRRAQVYTSLTFEKSTQQHIHRDAPFFHSLPPGQFVGVWTALEDIDDRAGPLEYYRGGHRLQVDERAIAARISARSQPATDDFLGAAFGAYVEEVEASAKQAGLPLVSPTMGKGDTLIWHAQLPHGGGNIADPTLTRASIVFHCTPEHVQLHGAEVFFGREDPRAAATPVALHRGRRYVTQGIVRFFEDG